MTTDEYVPSECEVRADFVWTHTRNFDSYLMGRSLASEQEHYGAQFDAMIAHVRRDAAKVAWDEGHRTPWVREPDECECRAWASYECVCGLFGTGRIVTPNPYRTEQSNE